MACAATAELFANAQILAYRAGAECAADRLLLAGKPAEAGAIGDWKIPKLPISGGALIARGVPEGPIVAKTLRAIEDRWVEGGFPSGQAFDKMVADALESARAGNGGQGKG